MRVSKEIFRRARRAAAFGTFLLTVATTFATAGSQDGAPVAFAARQVAQVAQVEQVERNPQEGAARAGAANDLASGSAPSSVPVPASEPTSVSNPGASATPTPKSEPEKIDAVPKPTWQTPASDGSTDEPSTSAASSASVADSQAASATPTGANAPRGTTDGSETFVGLRHGRFELDFEWPKSAGQFGVAYDVSTYAERFPDVKNPQNAIVNWIMFDAKEDFWRKEPFSFFSTSRERLFVYHTAEVQRYVSNVVDRFLDPTKRDATFSIKIVALESPDWRVRLTKYLTPRSVAVVGNEIDVQGWLLDRSKMATVAAEIEKRSDYLLLNSVKNVVPNGETYGWTAASPKRTFVKDVRLDDSSESGYAAVEGAVDEGFRVEATPLVSTNGDAFEVLFRYQATAVEDMRTFTTRAPTDVAPRQQATLERPEIVSCDVEGKIGAPCANAAIVDLGLVPMIPPKSESENGGFVGTVSKWMSPPPTFYDVLLLIEKTN